jgi:hypothetical protein
MTNSHRRKKSFPFPITVELSIYILFSSLILIHVLISASLAEMPPFKVSDYPEFSETLSELKSMDIVEKDGVLTFGKARLERRNYIRLLHLKGEHFELGYQHGILLKKEIINILKIRTKVESFFGFFKKKKTLEYLRHIESLIPMDITDEIKGMAAALDIDYDYMLAATLNWEMSKLGCTIVAAQDEASADKNIIYLRSMENHPDVHTFVEIIVIFYEPGNGNSFASVNLPGGIGVYSGINEKKLTVDDTLIRCIKADFNKTGVPLTLFRRMIIQYSNSMEDVQKYIETHQPSSPNNILVTASASNEIRLFQVGIDKFAVETPQEGILCATNRPTVLDVELNHTPEEAIIRYNFAYDFMKKESGAIDFQKLVNFSKTDFMTDRNKRVLQYIVIMVPGELGFWLAVQKEDNRQATYNDFIRFNLWNQETPSVQ